jgi:ABC-type branched-subunit amino acid transport system permease subunit
MPRDLTLSFLAVALVGLLALGAVLPLWVVFLLTVAFAKALVVIGLVVMMRAGLVSFGQGLYYGLGAYAAGLMTNFLGVTMRSRLSSSGVLSRQ